MGIFLKTPEAKVAWQKNRIENRVNEIQTLAETKTLTKAKQQTVNKALDNHVKELSKELTTLSADEPSTALKVTASLEESLMAKKQELTNGPTVDQNVASALTAVNDTLKVVSEQEVKILSKELDNIANAVQTVNTTTTVKIDSATTASTSTDPITPSQP